MNVDTQKPYPGHGRLDFGMSWFETTELFIIIHQMDFSKGTNMFEPFVTQGVVTWSKK